MAPVANGAQAPLRRHPVAGQGCLLYVEDDPVNRMLMAGLVERHPDVRLLMADDAQQGLKLASSQRPDPMLMDLNLPDKDGYALLKALRTDPVAAQIPAIAVTACAMPEDLVGTQAAGFADHLVKPIHVDPFDRLLAQFLPGPAQGGARPGTD